MLSRAQAVHHKLQNRLINPRTYIIRFHLEPLPYLFPFAQLIGRDIRRARRANLYKSQNNQQLSTRSAGFSIMHDVRFSIKLSFWRMVSSKRPSSNWKSLTLEAPRSISSILASRQALPTSSTASRFCLRLEAAARNFGMMDCWAWNDRGQYVLHTSLPNRIEHSLRGYLAYASTRLAGPRFAYPEIWLLLYIPV